MIVHPIHGQVLGPFAKIPDSAVHVRRLALDLCASLVRVDDGLHNAVFEAVKGTGEEPYWDGVTRTMRCTL